MAKDYHIITTEGQFDARKARQLLFEMTRDNDIVNRSHSLAVHLGLSSEEEYLLTAFYLAGAFQGLCELMLRDIETRVPTFFIQATKDGPFDTKAQH